MKFTILSVQQDSAACCTIFFLLYCTVGTVLPQTPCKQNVKMSALTLPVDHRQVQQFRTEYISFGRRNGRFPGFTNRFPGTTSSEVPREETLVLWLEIFDKQAVFSHQFPVVSLPSELNNPQHTEKSRKSSQPTTPVHK